MSNNPRDTFVYANIIIPWGGIRYAHAPAGGVKGEDKTYYAEICLSDGTRWRLSESAWVALKRWLASCGAPDQSEDPNDLDSTLAALLAFLAEHDYWVPTRTITRALPSLSTKIALRDALRDGFLVSESTGEGIRVRYRYRITDAGRAWLEEAGDAE